MASHCSRCACCYKAVMAIGCLLRPLLLLAMRLFWGYLFFAAGYEKLSNPDTTIKFFTQLHIWMPSMMAYLVGLVELIGGLMLLAGFGARLASIPLAIVMITAYLTAHYSALTQATIDPYGIVNQPPFNYLLTCLIVLAFGPGLFSIDALLKYFYCRKQGSCSSSSCATNCSETASQSSCCRSLPSVEKEAPVPIEKETGKQGSSADKPTE